MRIAQILNDKAHLIFEAVEIPSFPLDTYGNQIEFIDITNNPSVQEGWYYDRNSGEFTEHIETSTEKELLLTLEEMQMQTLLNTEYLVIISELNNL